MPNNAYESHRDMMRQSAAWTTDNGACLSHFHSSIELLYMVEGSMTVILDGEEIQVGPGECCWCSSYLIHSYQGEGKRRCIVAIIPLTSVPMIAKTLGSHVFADPLMKDGDGRIRMLLEMMVEASRRDNQPMLKGLSYTLLGMAMEQCALLHSKNSAQNELVRDILKYIHEHIDQPLAVKDVAEAFGYSESRFSHLFQERLRRTLHDYIRQLRCQQAAQLLRETEMTVPEIALSKGFESLQTFYRSFKRCYGVTPAAYRSMNSKPGVYAERAMTELYRLE